VGCLTFTGPQCRAPFARRRGKYLDLPRTSAGSSFRVSALSTSRADLSRKGNPIGCGKVLTGVRLNRGRWHSISTVSGLCLARAFLAIRQGQEVLFQPIMLLARFR
jgi:hypothetical protein